MKQCKHNRILSVLVALVMVFSMVPMTAYADSVDPISDDMIHSGVKTIFQAYETEDDTADVSVIGQVVYRYGKNGSPNTTILEDVINGQIYGLQVYDKCDGCNVGDVVVVTGTINSYGGVKQLKSVEGRIRVIENREPIAAQEVTISQLGNDYLSEYIYIKDITMGTYSTSNTHVNDASGSINIFQAASLPSGVSNGDIKGVYACFSVYNTTKQLRNGSSDDYVLTAPSITTQPSDAEVNNGETATFTVVASGLNLSYQWKINRDDGSGWNDISGANAASYSTSTVDANCDGYQYKCVVSNSGGDVESNTVTLKIKYTVSFDTKGGAETIASQNVVRGGKASTPTPPTKTGYVFDGWYSSDTYNAGSKWDFASNTVSADTTLLAKWLSTDAGITAVSLNGTAGTINGTDIAVVLPYGSTIPTDASAVSVTTVTGAIASTPVTADTGSTWTFTVTAEDGTTTKNYTVNVSVAANPGGGGSSSSSSSTGGASNSSDSSESSETDDSVVTVPEKGTLLIDSKTKMVYKVTKSGTTGGTVQFVKTMDTKAKTIAIPDKVTFDGITYKVTSIAANALKDNKTVTTVTVGKYVTGIGSNAFSGCTKLKKVTIGKSVTTIGSKAFYKCTSLTGITIPSKVKKIGDYAFRGCSKMKTIKLNTTLLTTKTVSDKAFFGVSTDAVVKVPTSKVKAYQKLLVKKGLSEKITIKKL